MAKRNALNILGIGLEEVTLELIKQAYRKAAQQYHPDRNPAGLEMMKLVNAAYEALKSFSGKIELNETGTVDVNYGEKINKALNAIMGLGLKIEICGAWVWVGGDTKLHKNKLREAGFNWASQKLRWYFRPAGSKSRPHQAWSMEKIRETYGSKRIKDEQEKLAKCA